jgi:pimeloyl-ACP methyl ester carboxylesterase
MSLGGLVSVVLASERPDLVSSLLLVDITPGVNADKTKHITAFVNGPKTFENFEELLQRTMAHNPTRSESSLRRGILHNAMQLDDGSWVWRHQRGAGTLAPPPPGDLWDRLGSLTIPVTLVRGMAAGSVVDDEDEAEFLRRVPHGAVIQVEGAGHSVQGDQPVILAGIIRDFLS